MKRTLINCLAVLVIFAQAARADMPFVSLEELLRDTDVIVVAKLTNVREAAKGGIDYGAGTLTVSEVIRGTVKAGDKLRLEWENFTGIICPRVDHTHYKDATMIWLLRSSANGTMTAGNSGRVLELKSRGTIDTLLKEMAENPNRSTEPPRAKPVRRR